MWIFGKRLVKQRGLGVCRCFRGGVNAMCNGLKRNAAYIYMLLYTVLSSAAQPGRRDMRGYSVAATLLYRTTH